MVGSLDREYYVLSSEQREAAEKRVAELDARVAALDAQAQPIIIKDRRRAEMCSEALKAYLGKIGLADKIRISVQKNITGIGSELAFDHVVWDVVPDGLDAEQKDKVDEQLDRITTGFYSNKEGLYFRPLRFEYGRLHRDILAETVIEPVSVDDCREYAAVYVVDRSSPLLKRAEIDLILNESDVAMSEIPCGSAFAGSAREKMLEDAAANGVSAYLAYNFSRRIPDDEVIDYVREVLSDSLHAHNMRANFWKSVCWDESAIRGLEKIRRSTRSGSRHYRCPVHIEDDGLLYRIVDLFRKLGGKKE